MVSVLDGLFNSDDEKIFIIIVYICFIIRVLDSGYQKPINSIKMSMPVYTVRDLNNNVLCTVWVSSPDPNNGVFTGGGGRGPWGPDHSY